MTEVLHALFVAWQNPDTRRFYPVARLAQVRGPGCVDCYEFAYIQGCKEADGFHPFISFPDIQQIYRSHSLFPMFSNRLLSPSRSDYSEYIDQLGLPPTTTSPITILSRSGGRRVTDTLELFPLPEFELAYGYRTWFWAHGLRHLLPQIQTQIETLQPEERLLPDCDTGNSVDPWAIKLISSRAGNWLGYMPSYLLDDAHVLKDTCGPLRIYVDRINPPSAPIQQRILCRVESCWPEGFVPYSSMRYQPLSTDAALILPPNLEQPC